MNNMEARSGQRNYGCPLIIPSERKDPVFGLPPRGCERKHWGIWGSPKIRSLVRWRVLIITAQKDHVIIRILQNTVFLVSPHIGPWNQNVESLCLGGVLGPCFLEGSRISGFRNVELCLVFWGGRMLLLSAGSRSTGQSRRFGSTWRPMIL